MSVMVVAEVVVVGMGLIVTVIATVVVAAGIAVVVVDLEVKDTVVSVLAHTIAPVVVATADWLLGSKVVWNDYCTFAFAYCFI